MTSGQNIQTVCLMTLYKMSDIVNILGSCHHPPPLETGCRGKSQEIIKTILMFLVGLLVTSVTGQKRYPVANWSELKLGIHDFQINPFARCTYFPYAFPKFIKLHIPDFQHFFFTQLFLGMVNQRSDYTSNTVA